MPPAARCRMARHDGLRASRCQAAGGTPSRRNGGATWLSRHLEVNGFDPFEVDGRDPAAFAWAILESERRLEAASDATPSIKSPSLRIA